MAIFSSIYTFVEPPTSALQHKPRANTQAGSSSSSNLLDLRVLLHIIAASCAARACETMINGLHNINTSNENRALRARTHAHHGTNNKDTHMICAKYHTHTTKRSSQHNTTQHNTTQHNTTQHNTTQHNGSPAAASPTRARGARSRSRELSAERVNLLAQFPDYLLIDVLHGSGHRSVHAAPRTTAHPGGGPSVHTSLRRGSFRMFFARFAYCSVLRARSPV